MNPFESTINDPIHFIKSCISADWEKYFVYRYKNPLGMGEGFDAKRGIRFVQKSFPYTFDGGELLDEKNNIRQIDVDFEDFVIDEINLQIKITCNLIEKKNRNEGDDVKKGIYRHLVIDCIDLQRHLDLIMDHPLENGITHYLKSVLIFLEKLFARYYPKLTELNSAKRYYNKRVDLNLTGFKLKQQVRVSTMRTFIEVIYNEKFVTKGTRSLSILQFFKGMIPTTQINWDKDLHELKFFIDCLYDDNVLEKKPLQQWKHLRRVFICKGYELNETWHRDHNKLKGKEKREAIISLVNMLHPKIQ